MTAATVVEGGGRRATSLDGWPLRLLHLVLLAAGWSLFAWSWYDVLGQPSDGTTLRQLLVGALVLLPALTVSWILHNVGIHRRKGPRKQVRAVSASYERDWGGREIVADFETVRAASIVVIHADDARKVYTAAGPPARTA